MSIFGKRPPVQKIIISIIFLLCFSYLTTIRIGSCKAEEKEDTPSATKVMVETIKFYQKVISPAGGDRCPMYPSCSNYALQAFQKHGFLLGWMMSADRLMRENASNPSNYSLISIKGQLRYYDPLENHDFWFSRRQKSKEAP